jgi:hypothetical protein
VVNVFATIQNWISILGLYWQDFTNKISAYWDAAIAYVGGIWNNFTTWLKDSLGWIYTDVIAPIGGFIEDLFDKVYEKVMWVVDGVKKAFEGVKNFFGGIIDFFAGASEDAAQSSADKLAQMQAARGQKVDVNRGTTVAAEKAKEDQAKADKKAAQANGGAPDFSPTTSAVPTAKVDYLMPAAAPVAGAGSTVVQSGAVQIFIDKNSGLDEAKLAAKIRQVLSSMERGETVTTGG